LTTENVVKPGVLILAAAASLFLAGCVLKGKTQAKVSSTPAPPKPAAVPAPAPPPPLSIPQTVAALPAPQPISPEALATTKPPEGPAEIQPAPRTARRGAVLGPPKPETPALTVPDQPPAPAPETARPPIQEILPAAELKRLQDSADARKRNVRKVLDQMGSRRLNSSQKEKVSRIRSFLQLSDDAEGKNDMRTADALAGRAQDLLGELQSGR
jgi:hypothetical protein